MLYPTLSIPLYPITNKYHVRAIYVRVPEAHHAAHAHTIFFGIGVFHLGVVNIALHYRASLDLTRTAIFDFGTFVVIVSPLPPARGSAAAADLEDDL